MTTLERLIDKLPPLLPTVVLVVIAFWWGGHIQERSHTFKVYDANGNTVTCMEIDRGKR